MGSSAGKCAAPLVKIECGEWSIECGVWRVESGVWRVESGVIKWKIESGKLLNDVCCTVRASGACELKGDL